MLTKLCDAAFAQDDMAGLTEKAPLHDIPQSKIHTNQLQILPKISRDAFHNIVGERYSKVKNQ